MVKTRKPEIESLLADRARFETWLEGLAEKAPHVPAHVLARVRSDYETRLSIVLDELGARADELREQVQTLDARVAELEADIAARRDLRAEDELRAAVGEYEPGAWEERAREHDESLAALGAELADRQTALARVRDLLTQATRPRDEQATAVQGARAAEAASELEITPVSLQPTTAEPMPVSVRPTPASLEASASVDIADAIIAEPAEPSSVDPAGRSDRARLTPFDEIDFLRTVVGRATPAMPIDIAVSVDLADAEPNGSASTEGLGPSVLSTSDPQRTLKCQECGTMNVPTEWYCEKCGGELAAF
jgi:hypothetical protein